MCTWRTRCEDDERVNERPIGGMLSLAVLYCVVGAGALVDDGARVDDALAVATEMCFAYGDTRDATRRRSSVRRAHRS